MMSDNTRTRATVDANVLVVAPLNPKSPPGLILTVWQQGRFDLILSEHILEEVARTHRKPYFRARLTEIQIAEFEGLLRRRATIVTITTVVHGIATHPEDDLILATAVSGDVDYLVTGDARFLAQVPAYSGVSLLRPTEFLALLQRT